MCVFPSVLDLPFIFYYLEHNVSTKGKKTNSIVVINSNNQQASSACCVQIAAAVSVAYVFNRDCGCVTLNQS